MGAERFPGNLKPFNELEDSRREFLIEHYKRCEAFWRHWTTTIWSIPSVAAAINVGAYTLLFGPGKDIIMSLQAVILSILILLNVAVTIGVYRHRYMQKEFGDRILAIEKYFEIPTIKLRGFSGSLVYFIVMVVISLISFSLFMCKIIYGC